MIDCIFLDEYEGWCRNQEIDMYMDYPSEHYCKNCNHRTVRDADEKRDGENPKTKNDN